MHAPRTALAPGLAHRALLLALTAALAACQPSPGKEGPEPGEPTTPSTPPPTPRIFPAELGGMRNVRTDYGAKGDGVTDDTEALQRALADGRTTDQDYFGRPKALFFPAGVYRVRDTLEWRGCCVTLLGQGPGVTILRLEDEAPGFQDAAAPRPVVRTPAGNMSFRQNVWGLTIDVGHRNPGAVALDWIANNSGAVREVSLLSQDGQGAVGLDMSRAWPGPCLVKDVEVQGFGVGVRVGHAEYGPTFERLTLRGQRQVGLLNVGNTLAVRTLRSHNAVPAVRSSAGQGSVVLLDAQLLGGASGASAIESAGELYLREVRSEGYGALATDRGRTLTGPSVQEHVSGQVLRLFDGAPAASLGLPVEETPLFHDEAPEQWVAFTTAHYGDTSRLQAALDSGRSTVYFPFAAYYSYNERTVTVPAGVRRIVGLSSVVNGDSRGLNGGGIRFRVAEASSTPLLIEQFGYGVKVEHAAARPVVLRHGNFRYQSQPGAGDLFLEDVELPELVLQPGQRAWARQLNVESLGTPRTKVRNAGGTLWVLGLKTEGKGPVIDTSAGGRTELLGTLIYPVEVFTAEELLEPAFRITNAQASLIYSLSVYGAGRNYAVQVEETRGGTTRQLRSEQMSTGRVPLFSGW